MSRFPTAAVLIAMACLLALPTGAVAAARACTMRHWVAGWTSVPTDAATGDFETQTLRQVIVPHLSGTEVRLRLSNRFGTQPVSIDRTTLARQSVGAAAVAGTVVPVTFGGAVGVSIPPGGEVVSDPVAIGITAFSPLLVSTSFPANTGPVTEHFYAREIPYATSEGSGDHSADVAADAFTALDRTSSYVVSGLDVSASGATGGVVAFGDSLTDGYVGSPTPGFSGNDAIGTRTAYPDALQRRLLATKSAPRLSVVAAGIAGNRILADGLIPQQGVSMRSRLRLDALTQPGVTTVILQGGANDIGDGDTDPTHIIAGLGDLVAQARAAGLRVLLGTLTPAAGARPESYGDAAAEATRAAVNRWIRSGAGRTDIAIVDFDAVLRDPSSPGRLNPIYDSGDGLHPNPAGYRAMAQAVDLAQLAAPACACTTRPALTVRVPAKYRSRLERATVTLDGQKVGTLTRRHRSVRVSFAKATADTVVVRTRIVLSGGRTVTRTQRLARCVA